MSLKFHEGLEDMQTGPFEWDQAGGGNDYHFILPDSTLYGQGVRAAGDVWNTILTATPAILQNSDHISTEITDGDRSTNSQGLLQLDNPHTWTPSAQTNAVNVMFARRTAVGDANLIGYFYYDDNDDVGNLIPFICQGNQVTMDYPSGIYQG